MKITVTKADSTICYEEASAPKIVPNFVDSFDKTLNFVKELVAQVLKLEGINEKGEG